MKVKKRVKLICISFSALFITLVFVSYHFTVSDHFQKIENHTLSQSANSLKELLKSSKKIMKVKTSDWANWEDAYLYLKGHNEGFIKKNITADILSNLGVDYVFFTNNDIVLEAYRYQKTQHKVIRLENRYFEDLNSTKILTFKNEVSGEVGGYLFSKKLGAIIYGKSSVLSGKGIVNSPGTLVFAKKINKTLTDTYSRIIGADVKLPRVELNTYIEKRNEVSIPLDSTGKLVFKIKVRGDLIEEGNKVFLLFFSGLVFLCLVFSAIIYYFIKYRLLRKIDYLINYFHSFSLSSMKKKKINLNEKDKESEFYQLQYSIEKMINHIEYNFINTSQNTKMLALKEMSGGVAHEINNPLTIMRITIGHLKKSILELDYISKERDIVKVNKMTEMIDRISVIVQGLKHFSSLDLNEKILPVKAKEIVDETLMFCHEKILSLGIRIYVDCKDDLTLECDKTKLSQVLFNLVENSMEAVLNNKKSDKVISILVYKENSSDIIFDIEDNGLGLDGISNEKIFDPFYSNNLSKNGYGLGLSVCKGIVDFHNGSINYIRKNDSSIFRIILPVENIR